MLGTCNFFATLFLVKIKKRNDGFICAYCGETNPPASKTCRNHCRRCLCSMHVDLELPGDRMSKCGGKMIPKTVEQHPKNEWVLVHECEVCGKVMRNKVAGDDEWESVLKVVRTGF